jgi:hypothetical protein
VVRGPITDLLVDIQTKIFVTNPRFDNFFFPRFFLSFLWSINTNGTGRRGGYQRYFHSRFLWGMDDLRERKRKEKLSKRSRRFQTLS